MVLTAAAACSGLGVDLPTMRAAMLAGRHAMRPLREFGGLPARFEDVPGAWLEDRKPMRGRTYGAASNLSLFIAEQALAQTGWLPAQTEEAWIFAGSSRGNSCELMGVRHGRRPHRLYAASNSMHSEIASAVSIECGIRGPWQVFSNGCASGLDALIWAAHAVSCGLAPRALVVSVDLPLIGSMLEDFASTGLISSNGVNDPYSEHTSGFFPAEAASAMTVEPEGRGTVLSGAWITSDAYDPIGFPPDGEGIARALKKAWSYFDGKSPGWLAAVCPHASGTRAHGLAEREALRSVISSAGARDVPTYLFKPFTGHSLGASGVLDVALLHEFLSRGELPPNLPGLAGNCAEIQLPEHVLPADGRTVLKISVGMGGHNALIAMKQLLVFLLLALACAHAGDPPEIAHGFVRAETIYPPPLEEVRYASTYNFTGHVLYPFPAVFLHKDAAAALQKVQEDLASQGLGLKIYDGYRPLSVQARMWQIVPDERYVSDPLKSRGRHTRGTAVDVMLVDPMGNDLHMPTPFDDFTEKAHRNSGKWTGEERANCLKLEAAMKKRGFIPFPYEWWHFDLADWEKYPPLDISFEDLARGLSTTKPVP